MLKVTLLTGGADKPYAFGLLNALLRKGLVVDFIGSDELNDPTIVGQNNVNFLNYRGDQNPHAGTLEKIRRVLLYYKRLIVYAYRTDSMIFHILWFNKFIVLDRTLLNIYYKALGKKIVFTAHNIDQGERDGRSTWLNRISLRILYHIVDGIFVHTNKMKEQLMDKFNVPESRISVIRFGINDTLPETCLTSQEARGRIGVADQERVILFFGRIAPYKGLDLLLSALALIKRKGEPFKLLVAGPLKREGNGAAYWNNIEKIMSEKGLGSYIRKDIRFIPDDEVECFFKAADVLVLPYRHIFQTGLIFLSYNFGLPVVATDVGNLREDIVEGETGFLCLPEDPVDLSDKLLAYFESSIYKNLHSTREQIRSMAREKYSWDAISVSIISMYERVSLFS